ncbi:MAG TPA: endonuclease/exonuclease/phosphatase family protein [Verrucomicrobiales bacterium]|nr:endonuclease/exonuclease/phosphatase family protein [Verrucomicrobiales bacterium]
MHILNILKQFRDSLTGETAWLRCVLVALLAGASANCGGPKPKPEQPQPLRLRVVSWNIHHGEGLDRKIDLERIAASLREWHPDLVALQEVDVKTQRSAGVDQAAELGRLMDMEVRFASAMEWGGGHYGLAILGPAAMSEVTIDHLPNEDGLEPRIAASIELDIAPGQRIRFVNTHLTSTGDALRLRQCQALTAAFADSELPSVLAGDLNAEPGSPELEELGRWLDFAPEAGSEPTVPADQPGRRIDFAGPDRRSGSKVIESRVPGEAVASDHRPVLVVLELTLAPREGPAER